VAPPTLDDDSGLWERVEDFAVEQLVAKARVETLDVAVLPRTAPLDVSGLMKPAELSISISQVALAGGLNSSQLESIFETPRTAPFDVSGLMKPAELSISQVALAGG
jgi:hypothetical protein